MISNQIVIVGHLGREPELRFTSSGQAVTNFSVATTRKWQDRTTQEWKEDTEWFNVTCWKDTAENVAESLTKGSRVVVVGRMSTDEWTDEEGQKKRSAKLIADAIAADLSYATVQITKNERKGGYNEGNEYAGGEKTTRERPPESAMTSRAAAIAASGPGEPADYDSEPF